MAPSLQRIGAIFANAPQRGRAGELALENLLEATRVDQRRDLELQVGTGGAARSGADLLEPGELAIDAKFSLDDFRCAAAGVWQGGEEMVRVFSPPRVRTFQIWELESL